MDIFGIAVLIFLVTDPFGNIAIFIAALKNVEPKRRLLVAGRELLFALGLLLLFLTFGDKVLSVLGLSREATAIAGGIILFVIAMRLIFPGPQGVLGDVPDGEPMLVPLATPAVAGPSALAVLMTLRNTHEGALWELYVAVILAWAATAFILLQASILQRFLGPRGLTAVERLMGMLLIMLSVDMLLDNLQSVLHISP
ncbi:MAG: MarC family protein [Pseudomonas sp.]|uniref:MarC family protein n=1 Tax=Pseudomonas sp. TaxID=306 RepID=UPI003D09BBB7